jgi:DNA-binding NarL/FixJ family response regulator
MANTQSIGIVIVDDQADVRRALSGLLKMLPDCFLAAEASSGREALSLAIQLKPDIILMDVNMPEMDGFETTKQLRNIVPDTKVIILTQHDSPQAVDAAKSAGASGFLVKSNTRRLSSAIAAVSKGLPYFPS